MLGTSCTVCLDRMSSIAIIGEVLHACSQPCLFSRSTLASHKHSYLKMLSVLPHVNVYRASTQSTFPHRHKLFYIPVQTGDTCMKTGTGVCE